MAQKIRFKRGTTTYADRAAAITALGALTFSFGEPVIVQYKSSSSATSADRFMLAIGTGDGAGAYKLVNTYDDANVVAAAVTTLQSEMSAVKSDLSTHKSDTNLHKTAADRTAIEFVGTTGQVTESGIAGTTLAQKVNSVAKIAKTAQDGASTVTSQFNTHKTDENLHKTAEDRKRLAGLGDTNLLYGASGVDATVVEEINFLHDRTDDIQANAQGIITTSDKTIVKTGGVDIKVNLKASGNGNILVKDASTGAISAEVDINYNSSNGILSLTRSGNEVKNINLPLESFLESGTYNAATEELWLTVKKQDGTSTVIKIPVASLITEWGVTSTSTVSLSKTRVTNGQDQLSANVKISATAGNAVKANADGLFVADKTADITAANNNANTRVKTIQTANANAITVSRSGDVVTLDIAGIDGGTF